MPRLINPNRLARLLADFAEFGKTANQGVTRLTLTAEDKQARDYLVQLAQEAGFQVKVDPIGNLFIRRQGNNSALKPILLGSHLDSQPQGGRFDGAYGVIAGLEVLLSLNDHQIDTERHIDLMSWTNEEGARFAPAMFGSAVFVGNLALDKAVKIQDKSGISMQTALEQIGYAGTADFSDYQAEAALELHIEQGPILENLNRPIGVVTGALGQKWYQIRFTGEAGHAGTTPMNMRKDAGVGMAQAICQLHQLGLAEIEQQGRITVGQIQLSPNSPNVIPAEAYFTLEIRHPNAKRLAELDKQVHELLQQIAQAVNLSVEIKQVVELAPIQFDEKCLSLIKSTADELRYPYLELVSGAGHDACQLAQRFPTAMIFIPCVKGISHNEAEDIRIEWAEAGAELLAQTTLKLAQGC